MQRLRWSLGKNRNEGREGIGYAKLDPVPAKGTQKYRKLIADIVIGFQNEKRFSETVSLEVQGLWTTWSDYMRNNLSWASIWSMPPKLVSFCLASTFNTLPSPNNLNR